MKNISEKVKRPTGVNVMIILYIILLVLLSLITLLLFIILLLPDTTPIKEGFLVGAGNNENIARMLGMLIWQFVLPILTMVFIFKRKYIPLMVCLVLGILILCQSPLYFIPALVSFIILCADTKTKLYIKNKPVAD